MSSGAGSAPAGRPARLADALQLVPPPLPRSRQHLLPHKEGPVMNTQKNRQLLALLVTLALVLAPLVALGIYIYGKHQMRWRN